MYKAGTCTAKQIHEYLDKIAPDVSVKEITTFKDTICVRLENDDVIYINEKDIKQYENDNSTRVID